MKKPPPKKRKRKYIDILRARFPKKGLRGGQTVPMDIDKIQASLIAANS